MADIFLSNDLRSLLSNKKVVFMGDSNIRALYKDTICLYARSQLISQKTLQKKMENSVFNDKLVSHGEKTASREYQEDRVLKCGNHYFSFYFITRVYNEAVEGKLTDMMKNGEPDVLVLNSCVWDLCRWGPTGVEEYQKNIIRLMQRLNEILSPNCLVIWMTTPPVSQDIKGGMLVFQLDFMKYSLRFHVMEANNYARKVVVHYGYDVLDVHYHLRMQIQRRCNDGIHWFPETIRYITNLLLTHISLAWDAQLPHRFDSSITSRVLDVSESENNEVIESESEATTPAKSEKQPIQVPLSSEGKKKRKKKKKSHFRRNPYHDCARGNLESNSQHRIQVWMRSPQHDVWQSRQQQMPYQFPEQTNFTSDSYNYPMPMERRVVFQFSAPPPPPRQISIGMDTNPYYSNFTMIKNVVNKAEPNVIPQLMIPAAASPMGRLPFMRDGFSLLRNPHIAPSNSLLGDPPVMRNPNSLYTPF